MRPIDPTSVSGASSCPACSGKGWLSIRVDTLPIPGWGETLCPACSGNGVTSGPAQPPPKRAEAA